MAYAVIQMRRFARQYKKLNDKITKDVDEAVVKISGIPTLGEQKKVIYLSYGYLSLKVIISCTYWATLLMMVSGLFTWNQQGLTKISIETSNISSDRHQILLCPLE